MIGFSYIVTQKFGKTRTDEYRLINIFLYLRITVYFDVREIISDNQKRYLN